MSEQIFYCDHCINQFESSDYLSLNKIDDENGYPYVSLEAKRPKCQKFAHREYDIREILEMIFTLQAAVANLKTANINELIERRPKCLDSTSRKG